MLAANFMSKAMRLAPAVRSRASLAAFRSPVRPVRAPARAINTAAAQQAQAHSNTQQVPVQQQQHGTQQQMPQQQQQQAQQQSVARQQAPPQQQQGMARQQPQQQQGMAQSQQQQRQPAGRRLQRVPLSAVLSPLDDFGPGFGRVGGFLRSIEDEMNSMMRAMEYGDNMTGGSLSPSADAGQELATPLQVDIHELEKEIVLQADTPGMTGADVKVTYEPETRMLSIAGKRTSEHSETDEAGRFSRFERTFGAFQRRFKLPQNVDTGAISAKVNNGELEVRIPKTAATPKQQEIKVE